MLTIKLNREMPQAFVKIFVKCTCTQCFNENNSENTQHSNSDKFVKSPDTKAFVVVIVSRFYILCNKHWANLN